MEDQEQPQEFSSEFSPLIIGNRKLQLLRESKEEIRTEIEKYRLENENLQNIYFARKQVLAISRGKLETTSIAEMEQEKYLINDEIKKTEVNILNLSSELADSGHQLQIDCIELTNEIASLQMEYKSIECLQNGVKTKCVKTDEVKRQVSDMEKTILELQQQIAVVNSRELIDLDKAMLVLTPAQEYLIDLERQTEKLKKEITTLKKDH